MRDQLIACMLHIARCTCVDNVYCCGSSCLGLRWLLLLNHSTRRRPLTPFQGPPHPQTQPERLPCVHEIHLCARKSLIPSFCCPFVSCLRNPQSSKRGCDTDNDADNICGNDFWAVPPRHLPPTLPQSLLPLPLQRKKYMLGHVYFLGKPNLTETTTMLN